MEKAFEKVAVDTDEPYRDNTSGTHGLDELDADGTDAATDFDHDPVLGHDSYSSKKKKVSFLVYKNRIRHERQQRMRGSNARNLNLIW